LHDLAIISKNARVFISLNVTYLNAYIYI